MFSTLLAVAAPAEARAVLRALDADPTLAETQWQPHAPHRMTPGLALLVTGIGKVNAGAAVARFAPEPGPASRIISIGLAGALPGAQLEITDAIAATASIYADEGLQTPDGFLDCAAMGFPLAPSASAAFAADPALLAMAAPLVRCAGPIATLSTCSGTDQLAAQVRERTGALAECMEGAAIAHIACRLGIPFIELRIISNTTGDRAAQRWDLPAALDALSALTGRLVKAIW